MKQLAERLNLAPSTVMYHLKKLEKLGLVKLSRTEQKRNLTVKYYKATGSLEVKEAVRSRDVLQYALPILLATALLLEKHVPKSLGSKAQVSFAVAEVDSGKVIELMKELTKLCTKYLTELSKCSTERDTVLVLVTLAIPLPKHLRAGTYLFKRL